MHWKLIAVVLAFALATPAAASQMTDAEVLDFAGKRTCKDGYFPYGEEREVSIPIFTLDPGIVYEFCFKLKKIKRKHLGILTSGLVELQAFNTGNSSCGTMSVWMIKTKKKSIFGPNDASPRTATTLGAAQANLALTYAPGIWRVLFRYENGCNQYSVIVRW